MSDLSDKQAKPKEKAAYDQSYVFSVAPMMNWTDRHDRFFLRLLSHRALLYTEMVTADAIRFGPRERLLDFDASEHPLALQLGGSEPSALAEASRIGEDWGYDELNLNVGCPSDRVQSGKFGACLMREPDLVGECVAAMRKEVSIPVTVKCRIGVDDQDPEESLFNLVKACHAAGVEQFIVHARKAWLEGLSPAENRDVPPLDYPLVYRLKEAFPNLTIVINGGIDTMADAKGHLDHVDGVMMGREAYKNPYILTNVDSLFYGDAHTPPTREQVIEQLVPYGERLHAEGIPMHCLTRHILGLYHGQAGGKLWRRFLSESVSDKSVEPDILLRSLDCVSRHEDRRVHVAGLQETHMQKIVS
mgnify:CR=1 FL=1